jgi:hypothetical protein
VVAPVLACAVVGLRGRVARLAGFATVVVPFVGMKVSADVAHAVEAASHWFGVPWQIWVDPTDLMALVVLPVAWRLSAPAEGARMGPRPELGLRQRLGVVLGAVACLATSIPNEEYETRIFLLNVARRTPEVQIYRSPVPLNCAEEPRSSVASATFELVSCPLAVPFEVVPLDVGARAVTDGEYPEEEDEPAPPPTRECDAVVVRTAGLADTVVFWRGGSDRVQVQREVDLGFARKAARAVLLESVGPRWFLAPSVDSQAWAYEGSLPETACTGLR